jgi:flagellin
MARMPFQRKIKEENIMRINTNLTALNTYSQYSNNTSKVSGAVAKLSSGYAINSAADNAAGLAISEKMRAQIRGLGQASSNSQDAISLVQTAEGALSSSTDILQRMREIAVQSSSDTNNDKIDRTALQDEFSQLQGEIDDISSSTTFNKKNLLDGSISSSTKTVSNAVLGNSSLAVSIGDATAGNYKFNVGVQQETAAVAGSKPTDESATLGTTAKNYFKAATAGTTKTDLATGDTSKVVLGANASASSLLNGNYSLTTATNTDGSLTVTAAGDNDKTFSATVTADQLATLQTNSTGANPAELDLHFDASADDAFTLALGVSNFSNTTNGISTLSDAIKDTTVSVTGGVTAQAATYGVYATSTGGESVKLNTGDTSVTFGNGVTVGFNELTASDLDTANKGSVAGTVTYATDTSVNGGGATDGGTATTWSNFKLADSSTTSNGAITMGASTYDAVNKITTFNATDTAGKAYTATLADSTFATQNVAASGTTTFASSLNFVDTTTGSNAFSADFSAVATNSAAVAGTFTFVGAATAAGGFTSTASVSTTGHNYSKVFGDGKTGALTNKGASSFTVSESANDGLTFQVGANEGDSMTINIEKMDSQTLGINSAKVSTQESASSAITSVDSAINKVSSQRAYLGAIQNRLDYKSTNLSTANENLTSAESQIRDVDMAKEMTTFTNSNILLKASTAMLAQANSLPQNVLSLIGG